MSFKVSASSWLIKTGNPLSKLVLLALANFADETGLCWPSAHTLSEMCETSERTVRRAILRLEQAGHITIKRSRGRSSNRYTITRQYAPGCQSSTVTNRQCNGDTQSRLTVTNSPPILSVQPVIEQGSGKRPLSSAQLIHLERERDREEAVIKSLRAQDFRSAEDAALLKKCKARIAAIDAATYIDL